MRSGYGQAAVSGRQRCRRTIVLIGYAHGMEPVLGDGLGIELGCWMEGCVARTTIRNAGEFNGFLKPKVRLFSEPLQFTAGELVHPEGFWPLIDRDVLEAHETARERFTSARVLTGN
jgi:L-Ala-D/L-Glu epimerase